MGERFGRLGYALIYTPFAHVHSRSLTYTHAHTSSRLLNETAPRHAAVLCCGRDERKTGIPMGPTGPMGFPWEWEWESELDGNGDGDGNGNDSTGMGGNGNRTVPVKR
jgi:hypothetical protein